MSPETIQKSTFLECLPTKSITSSKPYPSSEINTYSSASPRHVAEIEPENAIQLNKVNARFQEIQIKSAMAQQQEEQYQQELQLQQELQKLQQLQKEQYQKELQQLKEEEQLQKEKYQQELQELQQQHQQELQQYQQVLQLYQQELLYLQKQQQYQQVYQKVYQQVIKELQLQKLLQKFKQKLQELQEQFKQQQQHVIIVGHHPIYGVKKKTKDGNTKEIIQHWNKNGFALLETIYDNYPTANFIYLCADIHHYQENILTINKKIEINPSNSSDNEKIPMRPMTIKQYIVGTGGASQDDIPSKQIYRGFVENAKGNMGQYNITCNITETKQMFGLQIASYDPEENNWTFEFEEASGQGGGNRRRYKKNEGRRRCSQRKHIMHGVRTKRSTQQRGGRTQKHTHNRNTTWKRCSKRGKNNRSKNRSKNRPRRNTRKR